MLDPKGAFNLMSKYIQLPRHQLAISNTILLAQDLNALEKMILSEIIWAQDLNAKKNQCNYCFASNTYFRAVFNISEKQSSRIISDLIKKGYIKQLKYLNGDFRHIAYVFDKCFERDIALNLIKKPKP